MKPLADPQALQVLRRARLAGLAVNTRHGPHLTPEAFAVAAGRIWVVTSCKSVKVRSIRRKSAVSIVARSGSQSVSLLGRAEVLSPWSPPEAVRLLRSTPAVAEATARYAIGNVASMLGYALDLCRLPAGALPLDRVFVAITPDAGLLADGDEVVRTWGRLPRLPAETPAWADPPQDLKTIASQLPDDIASLQNKDGDCDVAFSSERGPFAVAATWSAERRTADVAWSVAKAAGLPDAGDFCTMFDDSDAIRPTQLRGVMLRGPGRTLRHKTSASVEQRARRATWWSGFETGTAKAPVVSVVRGGRAG